MEVVVPDLGSDMMLEILSRSTLETLGRCRLLSKELNKRTYESFFMNLHSQRTKILRGYFIENLSWSKYPCSFLSMTVVASPASNPPLKFFQGPLRVKASTNHGLLLYRDTSDYRFPRYIVGKPTTQQWREIPKPKIKHSTQWIGMMVMRSKTLHYKIVRLSKLEAKPDRLACEVFDSKAWRWKRLDDMRLADDEYLYTDPPVSACGSLHSLTYRNNVFAFDLEQERYALFPLPCSVCDESDDYFRCNKLVEYEGRLGLISKNGNIMELWVLEDYAQRAWSKRHSFSLDPVIKQDKYASPLGFYGTDIVMFKGFYRLLFLNLNDGRVNTIPVETDCNSRLWIFPFQSDFELVNFERNHDHPHVGRRGRKRSKSPLGAREEHQENFAAINHLMSYFLFWSRLFSIYTVVGH